MKTTADSSDSLVFECDLDEPPEKVWRALTEPRLLEAWLATADPRIGAAGEAVAPGAPPPAREPVASPDQGQRRGGRIGSSEYEVVTADRHRLVRYRWRDRESGDGASDGREVHSIVTVELVPGRTGGTHLRLTHGEFRIVSAPSVMSSARVTPITSARRRSAPILLCAMPARLRQAA